MYPHVREGLGGFEVILHVLVAADDPEVYLRRVEDGRLLAEPRVERVRVAEVIRVERIEVRVNRKVGVLRFCGLAHYLFSPERSSRSESTRWATAKAEFAGGTPQ